MELLLKPEVKGTYEKCKYKVKYWEHYFKKKHGRLPSKLDIREADREIRSAYRTYFELKSAALEQSFQDIDGFNSDDETPNSTLCMQNVSSANSTEDLALPLVDKPCDNATEDTEDMHLQNTEKTWGTHLNNVSAPTERDKVENRPTVHSNFTQKLFKNSSFSKRNPRKSLSFRQRKSETFSGPSKSLSQPVASSSMDKENSEDVALSCSFSKAATFKFFDSVKITSVLEPVQSKSLHIAVEDGFNCSRSVDAGWMERVALMSGTKLTNSSINETNFGLSQRINTQNNDAGGYDSEDIIDDSDEDSSELHVVKRRRMSCAESSQNIVYNKSLPNAKLDFSNIFTSVGHKNEALLNDQQLSGGDKLETVIEVIRADDGIKTNTKTQLKENNKKPVKTNEAEVIAEAPQRRTLTRLRKTIYELESNSEPESPFADPEEGDPDYQPKKSESQTFNFDDSEEPPEAPKQKGKAKTPRARKPVKEKQNLTVNKDEVEAPDDAGAPYELEYSVKPRIVSVPRHANLSKVIKNVAAKLELVEAKDRHEREVGGAVIKDKRRQALEKLEKKIASGNLNDNFVRVDLKKKIYARGKKGINFSKYKKKMWKQHKKNNALAGPENMGGCDGGMLTCFNCGQVGHFAQKCTALKGDKLLPLMAADQEYCPFPTLVEASQMAQESQHVVRKPTAAGGESAKIASEVNSDGDDCEDQQEKGDGTEENSDDDLLAEALKLEEYVKKIDMQQYIDESRRIKPYYEVREDGCLIDTPSEVMEALRLFGHSSFRPGQEKAVMRILSGQSTLVTLSTGSGKSLCYQLPAYLYAKREPCITLIISPLVSLMEDQVMGVPDFLKAACLHTNKTKVQREKILEAVRTGSLDVLLVSPEAIVAGEKSTGFGSLLRKLPPVAFACIDEAHCVSQWSHNFRPSYLMICRILKERLGIHTILGLTATATRATSDSIISHLSIPDGRDGIISDVPLPDNLRLTVSRDANRDQALLGLLLSERFENLKSVIVYCTRRQECERIASFLRTSLKSLKPTEDGGKKRKKLNVQAEPYHAGMSASRRRTIQNNFMKGDLRIVVATVAFGMGINKSDIRAVIHYNLPKNFESYVQEVGRAGRDGLPAHCHLFLDARGNDESELQRHVYSDSIDRHVIRKLLQNIFVPCSCKQTCPKHEVAFSVLETVSLLDIPEENISTLLCYLELHEERYIEVLSPAYTTCRVIAYGGINDIRRAAKECPPLAMALAMFGKEDMGTTLEFPVVDVAAAMGWDSGICKHKLKNLEWIEENGQPKRSLLTVQFTTLGFRLLAPGNLTGEQLDETLDSLYRRVVDQERTSLLQLHSLHETVMAVAGPTYRTCIAGEASTGELALKFKIREYFDSAEPLGSAKIKERICDEALIAKDVRTMVGMYRDNTFSGRAIARIFYGIPSPNYPAVIWGRCKFWRAHIKTDFNVICLVATREILKMR